MPRETWTNPSVLALSSNSDPIEAITAKARDLVFYALERGWQGPPFDPFALAELMKIDTVPTLEVLDARTVPLPGNRFRIEFNPDRPRRRTRYSVFHEIAHTLFDDCGQMIRNRGAHNASRPDDWQLETLCNIAAAEFLLPAGTLGQTGSLRPTIDGVLALRERYEASAEAALLRIRRLTADQASAFSCHRDSSSGRYIVEYAVPTSSAKWIIRQGSLLPARTAAAECTAIGYTAKGTEHWPHLGEVAVECIGIAPFPGDVYPRVIGFVRPVRVNPPHEMSITYLRGDATLTRGVGSKVLLQIVNDGAFSWGGGGFSTSVKRRWPLAQKGYSVQVATDRSKLQLGSVVTCELDPDVTLTNLVAQHGFGDSPRPRIRYGALRNCLLKVFEIAKTLNASVHLPRIGTGLAGGSWAVVEEIINETLTTMGIKVFVYDPVQGKERPRAQQDLRFTR